MKRYLQKFQVRFNNLTLVVNKKTVESRQLGLKKDKLIAGNTRKVAPGKGDRFVTKLTTFKSTGIVTFSPANYEVYSEMPD